ncbi:polymorphic toxin-type HINT domain-containing protein [Actinoplanes sp. Pm04-4]|uniref:Polymorphic toxin-type HINT domain-containing protein n=1 Tax=Paractinoplanes pyxinae TaxID=2997416 RepID=A0ABT4B4Y3_9ACTN|nr:polymorphic toxin-type HINT domain-containing protein [Actinoplanes pyxinae]MCY1141557.1 polymorphic toxin-type HINT domain-containing protein [Actinoplanes pyxinae]
MSTTPSTLSRRRPLAAVLTAVLTVGILQAPAQAATPEPYTPPATKAVPVVPTEIAKIPPPVAAKQPPPAAARPTPVWPASGTQEIDISAPAASGTSVSVTARQLSSAGRASEPTAGRIRVQTLDRAATERAGVRGVLMRVSREDAAASVPATLTVNYGAYASAYGADWSSRLRLTTVPVCALTRPADAACTMRPLVSANDSTAQTVSADIAVSGVQTLIALTAAPGGPAGDYAASPLSASSTWSAGGNSGAFTWSYPMRTPPSLGRPAPTVTLSYNSQSVDGMHAASNNQPSWIGQGFDMTAGGFIERKYLPCAEDMDGQANNTKKTGDLCWETDNATLSLAGHSGELIYNASEKRWHLRSDDGSRIERRNDTTNGDNNNEYWVLTTTDGTQYWFGRHRLPGWTTNKPVTYSTLTVPVFGNDPNEECHATAFADSDCLQAWRWNLDYVVDPGGNSMSYWYTKESNKYARNFDPDDAASYDRSAWLDHIDYGTRRINGVDSALNSLAPMRVEFTPGNRCLADCGTHDAGHWPDVPWDSECTGDTCEEVLTPTFWSTKRLATVTTRVRTSPTTYKDVERWTLKHSFPDPGDGTQAGLWLSKLSHAGLVGDTATVPDVEFTPVQKANRVDTIDFAEAMKWMRIEKIRTETGGTIGVEYSEAECKPGQARPAPENNTSRCYPVYWVPEGKSAPVRDWFNKYVVKTIFENDNTGGAPPKGSPRVIYSYDYLDGAAWHYTDDDGLVKKKYKTWSDYRGYGRVGVTVGDADQQPTYTETRYFRGMNDDRADPDDPTAKRPASLDGIADEDWHAGTVRESTVLNGPKGAVVSRELSTPWASAPTATRTINGDTVTARHTGIGTQTSHITLDGGRGERVTKAVTTYDSYGMPSVVDNLGQDGVSGDEQCTRTDYIRNTTAWIVDKPQRVRTFAVKCADTSGTLTTADVIGETRTSYDTKDYGVAPTWGLPTRTQELSDWNNGTPTFIEANKAGYDVHGRPVSVSDARQATSTIDYTPKQDGPVTATVTKNPLLHDTTVALEPAWGSTTATVDPNGKRTDITYDPLGRTTAVWTPGRVKGTDSAAEKYSYELNADAPSVVSTSSLNATGSYVTSYTLYDGLLRPRQTQMPSPAGGRLLTESFYDSAGRQVLAFGSYHADGAAGGTLMASKDRAFVERQTRTVYDGAGRVVAEVFQPNGVERWRTTTTYGGDRTDITPPEGGTASSTITDARDRTVELRQYHGPNPTPGTAGSWDNTRYSFDRRGNLSAVVDTLGNDWTYTYDARGRATLIDDPGKGKTSLTYDNNGNVTTSKDARGKTIAYAYDTLNRRRDAYDNQIGGPRRAQWIYDTVAKGQLSQSTRYVGTAPYQSKIDEYNDRYQPTKASLIIPDSQTGLSGTYNYETTYNIDGSANSTSLPETNTGLPAETLTTSYDTFGQPRTLTTLYGTQNLSYVNDASYNAYGELNNVDLYLGSGGHVYTRYDRDLATGRLTNIRTDRDSVAPYIVADTAYQYDKAGNVTQIVDTAPDPQDDNQCFTYDYLRRLTEAWTPADGNCDAAPTSVTQLGGPAAYWNTWQYDPIGNRKKETIHSAAGDRSTDYTYPTPGPTAIRPHAVNAISGSTTGSFTYNETGDMLTRPTPSAGTQTMAWDPEGNLESSSDTSGRTTYIYDADGNRLVRDDPTGKTLYLPGQEIRFTKNTTARTGTRYYSFAGSTIASRTSSGVTWLASDHQGSAQIAIAAGTQQASARRQTPFGTPRGTTAAWPNDKGFVGGTIDNTGLTHLGAREYAPDLGRFISVDPAQDLSDPQQWNAYAYANNSPVTLSDPTGLIPKDPDLDDRYGREKKGTGKYKNRTAKRGQSDDYHGKATVYENPDQGTAAICITDYGCLDSWQVTNIESYITAYNEAVARLTKANGGRSLRDFQYAAAMLEACMAGQWKLANCSSQTYPILVDIADKSAVAAAESDHGTSGANEAASAVFAGLMTVAEVATACRIGAGGTGRRSFSGETPVLLADRSTKFIADIDVGDVVLATDPETGEQGPRKVTATWVHQDDLYVLMVDGQPLTTTEDHPFWNQTDHQWQRADELDLGDDLLSASGDIAEVDGLSSVKNRAAAFNLTVDGLHTYYVLAGETPVLVHNVGCGSSASDGPGVTALGTKNSLKLLDRDKINILQLPGKGSGRWNWTRNKRFIDEADARGDEIRLYTDPSETLYRGGNVFKKEIKYLDGLGYRHFEKVDDYWVVTRHGS